MPERIGISNFVKLLDGEYVRPEGGDLINGPMLIHIEVFEDNGLVRVYGSISKGPRQSESMQWEVKASSVEDFLTKVQKHTNS